MPGHASRPSRCVRSSKWHMRERVDLKSPVRENRPPGSVRGAPGNRCPYLDNRRGWVRWGQAGERRKRKLRGQAAEEADRVMTLGAMLARSRDLAGLWRSQCLILGSNWSGLAGFVTY